ncbi:MAG TPA: hypothetical protein VEX38_08000, partial [Fimbriimonadaceae bacterium]|nr:hypothetical protein [Fimbriimonadaceae bacterium]
GADADMRMTMKVTKIEGDQITINSTVDSMTSMGQQAPPDMLKTMGSTSVMDRTGKTVQGSGGAGASMGAAAAFPTHPVKVGDTWESESEVQGKKVKAQNKFVKVETVNGKEAAHIQVTIPDQKDIKMTKPLDMWVELSNGMLLKMEMEGQSPTAPDNKMQMTMTRV